MNKLSFFQNAKHPSEKGAPAVRRFWHRIGKDPFVDWALIVGLSCLVALAGAAFGGYVYENSSAELVSMPPLETSVNPALRFDVQSLDRVITAFDDRAAERVLLTKGHVGPADPSLP